MAEIYRVEEMMQKEMFDGALPPTTDEAAFGLRRRLMEEQEVKEWANREEAIKKLHNERMNLLQSALLERERETEERHAQRIEDIRIKKTEAKDRNIAKIHRKRIKVIRKKFKERKKLQTAITSTTASASFTSGRDIIEEYADFGSKVYAPITREGLSLDKKGSKFEVHPEALTTYQSLHELHQQLPRKVLETRVTLTKVKEKHEKPKRTVKKHIDALKSCWSEIERKEQGAREMGQRKGDAGAETRPRCATPDYFGKQNIARTDGQQVEYHKAQDTNMAILLLQRLLRGRARQNMMFEGKEKRLSLIAELQLTEQWKESAQQEREKAIAQEYQEKLLDDVTEAIQGTVVAQTFDKLSKELVRYKQERKIAAMVKLAERKRRMREAEESGRRQAEQLLREREDKLFKSIMGAHQATVDSYLGSILTRTLDKATSERALQEATIKAEKLNKMVDAIEAKMNNPQQIVKDMVSSFLIPDVQRAKLQKARKSHQQVRSRQ
jgi:hypothetical protein